MLRAMKWTASLALLLAIVGPAQRVSAGNILVNPGFESGSLSPWVQTNDFGGPIDWFASSGDAHSGSFSAVDDGNKLLTQSFAPVATNSITEVSFWMRHPDNGGAPAFVNFVYSDNSSGGGTVFSSTIDWEFFNVTSLLAPGKSLTEFGIYGYTGGSPEIGRAHV